MLRYQLPGQEACDTLRYRGPITFSLFVSYSFTTTKTSLKEFPETKSDMSLFQWVLALN